MTTTTTTSSGNEQSASIGLTTTSTAPAATASNKKLSFPEAVPHVLTSSEKNGKNRKICYYTFRVEDGDITTDTTTTTTMHRRRHPVLYLHGFPGSGLEGGGCARQVAAAGGMLLALDRPGFGGTDPVANNESSSKEDNQDTKDDNDKDDDDDDYKIMEQAVEDMWTVIEKHEGDDWTTSGGFSLIGVSGGGPYTLCFLNSYLERCRRAIVTKRGSSSAAAGGGDEKILMPPKLHAISLAAALCPCVVVASSQQQQQETTSTINTNNTNAMLPDNAKMLYDIVEKQKSSWYARFQLYLLMRMTALTVTWIPASWMMYLSAMNPRLPAADRDVCRNDEGTSLGLISSMRHALRQGSQPAMQEACVLFRKNAHPAWLESLQGFYQDYQKNAKERGGSSSRDTDDDDDDGFYRSFPNIGIHHGKVDANVPVAHAEYIFHQILFATTTATTGAAGDDDDDDTKQQLPDDDIIDGGQSSRNNSSSNVGGGAASRRRGGIVQLVLYENLGHVSLLTNKTDDIARFAVLSSLSSSSSKK